MIDFFRKNKKTEKIRQTANNIVVKDHRSLPEKISGAFFNIGLEIAVKH